MWGDQGKLPSRVHLPRGGGGEGCPWLSVQGRAGSYSSLSPQGPSSGQVHMGSDPMR